MNREVIEKLRDQKLQELLYGTSKLKGYIRNGQPPLKIGALLEICKARLSYILFFFSTLATSVRKLCPNSNVPVQQ